MALKGVLNSDFWYKSYLLEFRKDGVLTDAFTFSVPPQSEEFVFPQRKSETKTYGGAVIADYGNDLVQINLSGNTINQELKLIFKSTLGVAYMTGQEEIFYLRDLLKKYGQVDKLENKEVYLYSLNGSRIKNTHRNPKWWKVFIGELNISRNERAPFTYNYKLSCTGMPEITTKKWGFLDDAINWINNVAKTIQSAAAMVNQIYEFTVGAINELNELINSFNAAIDAFNSVIATYSDLLNGVLTESSGLIIDTIALGDKVIGSQLRIMPYTTATVWNSAYTVYESCVAIQKYCDEDLGYFASTNSEWQAVKEFYKGEVDDDEIVDAMITLSHNSLKEISNLYCVVGTHLDYNCPTAMPNNSSNNSEGNAANNNSDVLVNTYGYKNVVISDSETNWDQLAQNYYGDSSKSYLIANYNHLPIDTPLKAGMKIAIPNLNKRDSSLDNEVYNSPDVRDNYGFDIAIEDSDFLVENGDLGQIGGYKNLNQALLNRYTTVIGARIRDEVYGIQATIGDAARASTALIQASISQTTMEDPRVSSIENVDFAGVGDNLTVEVTYIDKNGATRTMGGQI